MFATFFLAGLLARPMRHLRWVLAAILVLYTGVELFWWLGTDPSPSPFGATATTVGRALWIVVLPLLWIGALYLPSVTDLIEADKKGTSQDG